MISYIIYISHIIKQLPTKKILKLISKDKIQYAKSIVLLHNNGRYSEKEIKNAIFQYLQKCEELNLTRDMNNL